MTLITGLIAHAFGATIGGLFLAFPAIFPASASLIEKHEIEKKRKHELRWENQRSPRCCARCAWGSSRSCWSDRLRVGRVALASTLSCSVCALLRDLGLFVTSLLALATRRIA
jgi:hypothetical protein